jgi:hypothetical protein
MFPVYVRKCVSRKAVHIWVEKFSEGRSKVADEETEIGKWLRERSKDFCAVGFDALLKGLGQMYQCWCGTCRGINVFLRFEYHRFYF